MNDGTFDKLLNPKLIKKHLMLASLYLTGYELLKNSIVDDVKGFFLTGLNENGFTYSSDYGQKVLPLHRKVFEASCLWLAQMNAITPEDVEQLQRIREHRDKIAHDLPTLLVDSKYDIDLSLLRKMKYYIRVIGKFWGTIEVETDPDIDLSQVDFEGIRSGRALLFDYLISVVDEEKV